MKKIISIYNKIEEVFLVATIVVSVTLLFINVILRYIFNTGIYGADEIALICFIWMSWLGISIGERQKEHIRIDMLSQSLHGLPKKILDITAELITLAILIFLVYYGVKVVGVFVRKGTVTAMYRIQKYWIYLSVPLGSLMMGLRIVGHIVEIIRAKDYGVKKEALDEAEEGEKS